MCSTFEWTNISSTGIEPNCCSAPARSNVEFHRTLQTRSGAGQLIRHIYAQGFRSLNDFSIEVRPGLNVLVGPNGGGKTNILALFSFISSVAAGELGDAISASGGASKVFRKTGATTFAKEIEIRVTGEFKHSRRLYLPPAYERRLVDAGFIGLRYEWQFKIDSSLGYDETFFSEQTLSVEVLTSTLFTSPSSKWDFALHSTSSSPQSISIAADVINPDTARLIYQNRAKTSRSSSDVTEDIEEDISANVPLFYALPSAYLLRSIARDLRSGSTFNFDPAVCKMPNDSARPPSLEKNGNGLAATIYAIQKTPTGPRSPYIYTPRRFYRPETSKTLQQYFRLINPQITGVRARNNPFDNRIALQVSVTGSSGNIDFPLELASDGTVKWLAFTVALLTENSGFAIEEPENFLHPDIQRHAVELVRAETEGAENLNVLMTTHSETLLNATRPDELIIVSMEDGVTSAMRLDDPNSISDEIVETGFGLGYYYISGALND